MELKAAQMRMVEQIKADPENVIARAIAFNPATADIVSAVRAAPGPITGVAAAAVKHALRGPTTADTEANIIRFFS